MMDEASLRSLLLDENGATTGEIPIKTRLDDREDVGRSLVASEDFLSNEVIFREKPLLLWREDNDTGGSNYLGRFFQASSQVQSLVLDMYTPPDDSAYMKKRRNVASDLCQQHDTLASQVGGASKISKLIGIHDINAHEFPTSSTSGTSCDDNNNNNNNSALFAYGSKLAHSCCPNACRPTSGCTSSRSKSSDVVDFLEYKTIRTIRKGDLICFSYLFGNEPAKPTHQRRRELMDSFGFYCQCALCTGPDYARIHRCSICQEGRITCRQLDNANQDQDEESSTPPSPRMMWTCSNCGPLVQEGDEDTLVKSLEQNEKHIQEKLHNLQQQQQQQQQNGDEDGVLMTPTSQEEKEEMATNLVLESSSTLSDTHYLTLQCMLECIRRRRSRQVSSQLSTAQMRLQYIRSCECIAAKCLKASCWHRSSSSGNSTTTTTTTSNEDDCSTTTPICNDYYENHPPTFACKNNALLAFEDLQQQIPNSPEHWPDGAVATLQRYVPLLYLCFGAEDPDVQEMEEVLSSVRG